MLDLNNFITEVHDNAMAHGWWEGDRSQGEILSLIHSELSEALEEYRAARPNIWYACEESQDKGIHVCAPKDEFECLNFGKEADCKYRGHKPEGIAVELADAVIRVFDFIGAIHGNLENENTIEDVMNNLPSICKDEWQLNFPDFICELHSVVAKSFQPTAEDTAEYLMHAVALILTWITGHGIDAEKLLLEKHNYNKSRPYKHGNKVC